MAEEAVAEMTSQEVEIDAGLEKKIIKQVEYYFGDINLNRDKFLQEQIKLDSGWVTLETMVKFNRLKVLSEDHAVIASCLKKSDLMEVSEDKTKIRRSVAKPLPDISKDKVDDQKLRIVYAKGFPLDATLDQVLEFFEKFGPTEHVQMRKGLKKEFKGSCFVIYADKENAKAFIETPDVKFSDAEMIRLLKEDYYKMKNDEKKKKPDGDKTKKQDEKDDEEAEKRRKITTGAILHIEGLTSETKREEIKAVFEKYGTVEWVDFTPDEDKTGRVRFGEEDGAKKALEEAKTENEGKIIINGAEVECRVLEGDEEAEHWANIFKSKRDKFNSNKDRIKKRRWDRDGRGGSHQRKRVKYSKDKRSRDDDGGDE